MITGLLIGFGVGALAAAVVAIIAIRRHLRRVRTAERRARAAERLAEIGSMTGGLAHEIKNPLSTIGLNVQLLLEGLLDLPVTDQERAPLINRAKALRRESDRLAGILQDFLQFAGQVVLERRPTDVNEMVSELVDFYTPEAIRQGVRIRAELAPDMPRACIDAKLIKQAMLNLMLNATQAMSGGNGANGGGGSAGAGGGGGGRELILRTESARESRVGRRAGDARDRGPGGWGGGAESDVVRIHVIDTGPGISPEVLERIFQPYFTTKAGGSGLGLPTSRRLIHEHGGRLDVHSELGKGTDFTVVLPVEAEPVAAAGEHAPARGTAASPGR